MTRSAAQPTGTAPVRTRRVPLERRAWLWFELVALYAIGPALVAALTQPQLADPILDSIGLGALSFKTGIPRWLFIFPILLGVFVLLGGALVLDPSFDTRRLWNTGGFRREIRRIGVIFICVAPLLLFASWYLAFRTDLLPERGFLRLPRELPVVMTLIAILYPWLSAYPQEVTHRAFFFHRYRSILGDGALAMGLNVAAFSWLHAPMWNGIALLITIPLGLLLAQTYRRSGSTLAAGFEHAIYGVWAFFCGLGYFVFTGNVQGV